MDAEIGLGTRLVEVADRIIASGGNLARPAAFLSRILSEAEVEVFGDPLRPGVVRFPSPEVIWKAWKKPASKQWDYIEGFLEVIAEPGDHLEEPLQKGDILVRVAPGEPGLGHLALIADPQWWWREQLAAAGLTPEGHRPGRYVQVVEGGARPHGLWDGFARRIADETGRLTGNQLVLRLRPGLESLAELTEAAGVKACLVPQKGTDPSALRLYPAGKFEYDLPITISVGPPVLPITVTIPIGRLRGVAYYPAESKGAGKLFNKKLAKKGPVPIVFIAHGNHSILHDPADRTNEDCTGPASWKEILNYKGYEYFQEILACMGIISVSVDCNETNCKGLSETNIWERSWIIYNTIKHFVSLHTGADPIFGNHIDFSRTGLMGHSRGGEAVIQVPMILNLPGQTLPGVSIKGIISLAPTDVGATQKPQGYAYMAILPAGDYDVSTNDGAKFYDLAGPDPFKCQLYIDHACHNYFNTEWVNDEAGTRVGPAVMSKDQHKKILAVFGSAFYRAVLLGADTQKYLFGGTIFSGVKNDNIHISFERSGQTTVDDHENGVIFINSLNQPADPSGGLTAGEFNFSSAPGAFNSSFFGKTVGMVAQPPHASDSGQFRQQLASPADLTKSEIWIRTAEIYAAPSVPTGATGFQLGVEDAGGTLVWVDSDQVGGLPRPYHRRDDDLAQIGIDLTKSMLNTLRFPAKCFTGQKKRIDLTRIQAIRLKLNRKDDRPLAFDQLQIVTV
jgi:hypothetical protein